MLNLAIKFQYPENPNLKIIRKGKNRNGKRCRNEQNTMPLMFLTLAKHVEAKIQTFTEKEFSIHVFVTH